MFEISIENNEVRMQGRFNAAMVDKATKVFDEVNETCTVDFDGLIYISSAGLRVILKATKAIKREDGRLLLCSMQDYVKEVFEIAGFDSFLPIVATMDDALKSF